MSPRIGGSSRARPGGSHARFKNGDQHLPSPSRYQKTKGEILSETILKGEEKEKEELDGPIPPFIDGPGIIRRIVAEYDGHIVESATVPYRLRRTLEGILRLNLEAITAVRNVLLEQIDHLQRAGCLSLNPLRKQREQSVRLQLSVKAMGILTPLSDHVQALCSSSGEDSKVLKCAQEIYLVVELILSHLLDPAKDNANISGLLADFYRSGLRYVSGQYEGDPSAFLRVDKHTDLNPSLGPCPLEDAFINFLSNTKRSNNSKHSLIAFIAWARMENIDSEISRNIGPVTSASLYQATKGPIRHEFAIIAFHSGKAPASWLRMERIPRFKTGWFNFDVPEFSGIEACDNLSFSISKLALIGNDVVKIAEMSIAMNPTVLRLGVCISEFAESLAALSSNYPKYSLLATNCRYFARRMVLDVTQRIAKIPSLRTQISIKLGHSDRVSYRKLADKFQDKPFPGPPLADEGVLSKAERILGCAQRHSILSRDADALRLCDEAVDMLESMPRNDAASQNLIGRCLTLKCEILQRLHRFNDAYAAGQTACSILGTAVDDDVASHVLEADCLARALHQCSYPALELGFNSDAIRHSREGIAIRRLLLDLEPQNPHHLYHVGFALGGLSLALSTTGEMTKAVESGQEGVQILRALHSQQPDVFGDGLAGMLHNYSLVLATAKQREEAHAAAAEVVELRRTVNMIPEHRLHLLAFALYSYATRCVAFERWEDSIAADKESLNHYQWLRARRPVTFDTDVIRGWRSYGRHLKSGNHLEEAFACRRQHVQAVRSLFEISPKLCRPDLALALYRYALYASECQHMKESIQAAKESLQHYQILAEGDPKYEDDVIKCFTVLSTFLSKSGLMEESIRHRQQGIVVLRRAFAKDSHSWRKNLAGALFNLGSNLAEVDRWAEAVVEEEEALQHYLVLAENDPGRFKSDVADAHGLLSLHLPLSGNLEAGVNHGRQKIEILRSLSITSPDSHHERLAIALSKHATNLNAAESWEEMITASSESLQLYRRLAESNPEEHNLHVMSAVDLLADHLSDAERYQEAADTRKEHVAMLISAATRDPQTYNADLAYALSRLADDLHNVKQWDMAIKVDHESLEMYRSLAKDDRAKYESDIANGLNQLADHLSSSGQYAKSLDIRTEYVSMHRSSASQNPESHQELLAFALSELANDANDAELWDKAVEASKESLTIYRSLAKDNPEKYRSEIKGGLSCLSDYLTFAEEYEEARDVQKEYVAILRAAAAKDPETHLSSLSSAVHVLGEIAAELELWDEACEADSEALQILRDHEKVDSDEYTESVMETLRNFALHLQSANRVEEAMPHFSEQLTLARALFAKDPDSNRSNLAEALYYYARGAEDLESWDDSITADKESLELYRVLAEKKPNKFATDVIQGLDLLARHLECADRREEALLYRREQVSRIRTSLDTDEDSDWNPAELAEAFVHIGLDAADSQLLDESIQAFKDSLKTYLKLAKDDFDTFCAEIIEGLCSLARHFFNLRRFSDSITAGKEALALSNRISGTTPSGDRERVVDVLEDFAVFLKQNNFKAQAKEFKERADVIDEYETEESSDDDGTTTSDESDSDGIDNSSQSDDGGGGESDIDNDQPGGNQSGDEDGGGDDWSTEDSREDNG